MMKLGSKWQLSGMDLVHFLAIWYNLTVYLQTTLETILLKLLFLFYIFFQLKVDKSKLIEVCGTSESEFGTVRGLLCYATFHLQYPCIYIMELIVLKIHHRFQPRWTISVLMFLALQRKRKIQNLSKEIEVLHWLSSRTVSCLSLSWTPDSGLLNFLSFFGLGTSPCNIMI